jgi:FixJ family two-component response regulator
VTAPAAPLVFIVDDDASVRRGLARLVRTAGFDVETFASAGEFLACPRYARVSCLVLDVRMPGLTGLDLQETLAAAGQRVPIVFITGYPDARSQVKAMNGGAIDFLRKPVSDRDLLDAIERAVTKSHGAQHDETRMTEMQNPIRTVTRAERGGEWVRSTPFPAPRDSDSSRR